MNGLAIVERHDPENTGRVLAWEDHFTPMAYPAVSLSFAPQWRCNDVAAPLRVNVGTPASHLLLKVAGRLHQAERPMVPDRRQPLPYVVLRPDVTTGLG